MFPLAGSCNTNMNKIILHSRLNRPTRGTNGHTKKYSNVRKWLFVSGFTLSLLFVIPNRIQTDKIIRANVHSYDVLASDIAPKTHTPTPTAIPTPTELENIVSYITRKFEGEGKEVVVWAINCFYSESGLRPEAVNDHNTNGTTDRGLAQVNSVHRYSAEELHTIEGNIDAAYEIYQRQGKGAWYGAKCK